MAIVRRDTRPSTWWVALLALLIPLLLAGGAHAQATNNQIWQCMLESVPASGKTLASASKTLAGETVIVNGAPTVFAPGDDFWSRCERSLNEATAAATVQPVAAQAPAQASAEISSLKAQLGERDTRIADLTSENLALRESLAAAGGMRWSDYAFILLCVAIIGWFAFKGLSARKEKRRERHARAEMNLGEFAGAPQSPPAPAPVLEPQPVAERNMTKAEDVVPKLRLRPTRVPGPQPVVAETQIEETAPVSEPEPEPAATEASAESPAHEPEPQAAGAEVPIEEPLPVPAPQQAEDDAPAETPAAQPGHRLTREERQERREAKRAEKRAGKMHANGARSNGLDTAYPIAHPQDSPPSVP